MSPAPKHTLKADQRDLSANLKQLRASGHLPANIFEANKPSQAISLDLMKFEKLYLEVGESGVAYLKIDAKTELPVMIDEVQFNPVTDVPIHATFQVVDLTEKVRANISVELEGEFELAEAVLVTVMDEIEVEALPTDLPEEFVINVESLTEIGQSITLADLNYDKDKVEIILGDEGWDEPIILVQEVEEEPEEPEEPVETEIIGEKEAEEEEEKAEEGEGEEKAADQSQEAEDSKTGDKSE